MKLLDKPKSTEPLSIKANMLWNSIGSLTNLGCQWLITVMIVRLSSAYDAAGIYSLAVSTYNIFGSIAQYRMYTYQVSDVNNENTTGEYMTLRLITSSVALAACSIYGIATCSKVAWASIALYGIYKTITLVIDVYHACDQRFHRMDFIGVSLALQGILSLVSFLAIFSLTQSVELGIVAMAIAVGLIGFLYDSRKTRAFGQVVLGISPKKTFRLLSTCLPVVIAGMATSAASSLPRQALANIMGTSILGAYASVAAPVAIIQMGASYIYNPLLGYFSELYASSDTKGFLRLLTKSMGGLALISLICVFGFSVFGNWLLITVFGESISEYTYLLIPLVGFAIITGIQWFINDLLISLRAFKMTFFSSVLSFVVAFVLEDTFIRSFGPNGVTITGIVSCIASLALMSIKLSRMLAGNKKGLEAR